MTNNKLSVFATLSFALFFLYPSKDVFLLTNSAPGTYHFTFANEMSKQLVDAHAEALYSGKVDAFFNQELSVCCNGKEFTNSDTTLPGDFVLKVTDSQSGLSAEKEIHSYDGSYVQVSFYPKQIVITQSSGPVQRID